MRYRDKKQLQQILCYGKLKKTGVKPKKKKKNTLYKEMDAMIIFETWQDN